MSQQLKPTKQELIEYGKNMYKLDTFNQFCRKLESFAEDSEIDGFQLVHISPNDLYAENWDEMILEREYEWDDYKKVEWLAEDNGYGRTLYPDEAKFLIDMFESEPKKEFYVGVICNGVIVNSVETDAVDEDDDDGDESESDLPLTLLAQRTANEHEEAFGKMMEAMAAMDYNKVQSALTVLNACRERAKEICGLTEEWRVKVEAEMKLQWEEKHGQKIEGSAG
jgi:hypothetical protein